MAWFIHALFNMDEEEGTVGKVEKRKRQSYNNRAVGKRGEWDVWRAGEKRQMGRGCNLNRERQRVTAFFKPLVDA